MKMERLIGILSILLQREKVTAPELAEQFEVSRRTIQRDIESLCRAGIPIATTQGSGGGISIMEGYRVDRTVLTAPEMQAILAGLRSLDSVSGTRRYAQLMEKLSAGNSGLVPGSAHMLIDLSSWYKSSLAPKPDGQLLFRWVFPDADSVISWILTFGDGAELLEPAELREQLAALAKRLAQRYEKRR